MPSTGHPSAYAAGLCPSPSSNNIAEFYGFRASLRRALREPVLASIVFELDSLLVVKFMTGEWGCHRAHLRVLLQECHDLGERLRNRGCEWTIRHIYREYNVIADWLAGEAIASRGRTSPLWCHLSVSLVLRRAPQAAARLIDGTPGLPERLVAYLAAPTV